MTYSVGSGGSGGAHHTNGGAGGDTYVCNSTSNCAALSAGAACSNTGTHSSVIVCAQGGGGGTTAPGAGSAGSGSSGIGTVTTSGGAGGGGNGAGGGAGGPNGTGGAGNSNGCGSASCGGAGGGGNGGGTAGSANSGTTGGAGGNNYAGSGSGSAGNAGTNGGGGGGGSGSGSGGGAGGAGGAGTDWDASHGSGGGGGGGGTGSSTRGNGGNGGNYGAGGGSGSTGGTGAQGIVAIRYTPQSYSPAPIRSLRIIGSKTEADARTAKTVTANGNAQIDTAQYKFGGASALFDGTGDWLSSGDSADWDFGTGDFTIDFWIRRNGVQTLYAGPVQAQEISGNGWGFQFGDGTGFGLVGALFWSLRVSGSSSNVVASTVVIPDNTWTHIAVVRASGVLTFYQNGVAVASAGSYPAVNGGTGGLGIGRLATDSNNYYFNGWIDELRVSKGIARWTSNFTPPTAPDVYDEYTKLLLHMDGTDASTVFTDTYQDTTPNRQVIVFPHH